MYERRDDEDSVRRPRSGLSPALIGVAIVAVVALVFVLQNREEAPIEFLFFSRDTPVWVAIAIAIGLGVLLDRLIVAWWRRGRRRDDR